MVDRDVFYETFWEESDYQLEYALDAAVRDRYPALERVWGDLLPPRRVLDFGCGNGVLTYWMHRNGFGEEIKGVDISRTAIRDARRRFRRDGLEFEAFDPDQPLSGLGAFDVVVSSHVLEHIDEPAETLARIRPLAERFVFEVPLEACFSQSALWALRRRPRASNGLGHVNFWSRESFRELIESCGFAVVRDYQYASAPFSPYQSRSKRIIERAALSVLGVDLYSRLLATHYAVLAIRKLPERDGMGGTGGTGANGASGGGGRV